jgi:hypothetical protein
MSRRAAPRISPTITKAELIPPWFVFPKAWGL